jgi:trans-aconitate 2-methyltransferase
MHFPELFLPYSSHSISMNVFVAGTNPGVRGDRIMGANPSVDWNASEYCRQSSLQKVLADKRLARLTLSGTEHVLDVGCGDGKITAEIAARVPGGKVLGTDPSPDMIRFAASHFEPERWPNLRFEVADARSLPYRSAFDLVVSFNALHWVPEQEAALRSIRATMRPGGKAYLVFVPQGERKSFEDVIEEARQSARWAPFFQGFTRPYVHLWPDQYRALAEKCGFQVLRMEVEDDAWDFHTREAFAAFCRATMVSWTRMLPDSEEEAFTGDSLDRYEAVAASTPGERNMFKFYQMEVELSAVGDG